MPIFELGLPPPISPSSPVHLPATQPLGHAALDTRQETVTPPKAKLEVPPPTPSTSRCFGAGEGCCLACLWPSAGRAGAGHSIPSSSPRCPGPRSTAAALSCTPTLGWAAAAPPSCETTGPGSRRSLHRLQDREQGKEQGAVRGRVLRT